jgi:hypothetical protein
MKICKTISITLITVLLAGFLSAQKAGPDFLDNTHQHKVSAEFLAASYSYAHEFKRNISFGARVQIGHSAQFIIASAIQYDYGYGDGLQDIQPRAGVFDFLKFQIFYRCTISRLFYFDLGPFVSITPFSQAEWTNPVCVGIEISPFFTINRFHLGFRIKAAMSFERGISNPTTDDDTYYGLYATPIVVGLSF